MKKSYFVCMCLLLIGTVSPAIADLDGIQILSQQYHVWGDYFLVVNDEYTGEPIEYSDSYDLYSTDSSGINGNIGSGRYISWSNAEQLPSGRFYVDAYASDYYPGFGISDASVSLSFQSMTSGWLHAEFHFDSYAGEDHHATLSDLTSGVQLFHSIHENGNFSCDWAAYDTHTYLLDLSIHSSQGDPGLAYADLSFIPAPEPATLFLLTLGGLLLRKRKS